MSRFRWVRNVVLLSAAGAGLVASPAPAGAQSLLARGGLGLVAEPLSAHARGLGGVGLGLLEPSLSLISPAEIAGLAAPTLHVTVQPDYYSAEFGGLTSSGSTVRFPLIHVALPLGERWAISAGYGALLDQSWAAEQRDSLVIGGERVEVVDRFTSRGGVARLRLGAAYRLGEQFAAGLGVDVHTGSVRDSVIREFGASCLNPLAPVAAACSETVRQYSGIGYTAGLRWAPSEAFRLSAAAGLGGTLKAETNDTLLATRRYDLPATASLGASGRVASNTTLALSTRWEGWSSADAALQGVGGARDTWSVGGGVEWEALSLGEQTVPLRIGGRFAALPFRAGVAAGDDGDWVDERVVTAGTGLRLGGGAALADLSVERGERAGDGSGFSESFWRIAVSLTVLGR